MFAPGEVLGNFVEEEERLLRLLDTLNNAFETRLAALASKQLMARMNIKPS